MSSRPADGCVLVIFGASGDLTHRKLLPSIYNLAEAGHLPERFAILGIARPMLEEAGFRKDMRERVHQVEAESIDDEHWRRIEEHLHYVSGDFNDPALYQRLAAALDSLAAKYGI